MGHQEAKTGGRSEQREKSCTEHGSPIKRKRVGDSVQELHAAIVGETNPHDGYAKVSVLNAERYCIFFNRFLQQVSEKAIRIITPKMPKANYTLQVEIMGTRPV